MLAIDWAKKKAQIDANAMRVRIDLSGEVSCQAFVEGPVERFGRLLFGSKSALGVTTYYASPGMR